MLGTRIGRNHEERQEHQKELRDFEAALLKRADELMTDEQKEVLNAACVRWEQELNPSEKVMKMRCNI